MSAPYFRACPVISCGDISCDVEDRENKDCGVILLLLLIVWRSIVLYRPALKKFLFQILSELSGSSNRQKIDTFMDYE